MSPAKAADLAVIEIDRDAVRLLLGHPRAATRGVRTTAARGERGRRRGPISPVRHVDSRLRYLAPDEVAGALRDPEAGAVQALAAVSRYLRLAERAGAPVLLVARQQLRRTSDGAAILGLVAAEIPEPLRYITPRQEAELVFLAIRSELDEKGVQLAIDLSGDTTGVLLAENGALVETCPIDVSVSSVAAALPDPPTPLEWALEAARMGSLLSKLPAAMPARAVAVGDGANLLAGFDSIRGDKAMAPLSLADLDRLSDNVVRASARKVARRVGDDPWRVSLLAPSALVLAAILERYGLQRCSLLPQGLRDGVILAATADPEGWWHEDAEYLAPAAFDAIPSDG